MTDLTTRLKEMKADAEVDLQNIATQRNGGWGGAITRKKLLQEKVRFIETLMKCRSQRNFESGTAGIQFDVYDAELLAILEGK